MGGPARGAAALAGMDALFAILEVTSGRVDISKKWMSEWGLDAMATYSIAFKWDKVTGKPMRSDKNRDERLRRKISPFYTQTASSWRQGSFFRIMWSWAMNGNTHML